jgi:hypothetical protein
VRRKLNLVTSTPDGGLSRHGESLSRHGRSSPRLRTPANEGSVRAEFEKLAAGFARDREERMRETRRDGV